MGEALVKLLLEKDEDGSDDQLQARMGHEFARMDDLWRHIVSSCQSSSPCGIASSHADTYEPVTTTFQQNENQAMVESLDETGYCNISALGDMNAMKAFIRRISLQLHVNLSEATLDALAR